MAIDVGILERALQQRVAIEDQQRRERERRRLQRFQTIGVLAGAAAGGAVGGLPGASIGAGLGAEAGRVSAGEEANVPLLVQLGLQGAAMSEQAAERDRQQGLRGELREELAGTPPTPAQDVGASESGIGFTAGSDFQPPAPGAPPDRMRVAGLLADIGQVGAAAQLAFAGGGESSRFTTSNLGDGRFVVTDKVTGETEVRGQAQAGGAGKSATVLTPEQARDQLGIETDVPVEVKFDNGRPTNFKPLAGTRAPSTPADKPRTEKDVNGVLRWLEGPKAGQPVFPDVEPGAAKREVREDRNGVPRFLDTGEPVFPNVKDPAAKREVREDAKGVPRFVDTGEPVFPGVEPDEGTPSTSTVTLEKDGETKTLSPLDPDFKAEIVKLTNAGWTRITRQRTGDLSTGTRTKVEGEVVKAREGLARLKEIKRQIKPEYLELQTRFSTAFTAGLEKLGVEPSTEDRKQLRDFTQFKRRALSNLNQYIKDVTGAQMSEAEVARLRGGMPDPGQGFFDGDSPTQFSAKLDDTIADLEAAQKRYEFLAEKGLLNEEGGIRDTSVKAFPLESFRKDPAESGTFTIESGTTQAEIDALPPGTIVTDPETGQTFIKP